MLPNCELTVDLRETLNSLIDENFVELCSENVRKLFDACNGKQDIYEFSEHIENGLKNLNDELKDYEKYIRENSI